MGGMGRSLQRECGGPRRRACVGDATRVPHRRAGCRRAAVLTVDRAHRRSGLAGARAPAAGAGLPAWCIIDGAPCARIRGWMNACNHAWCFCPRAFTASRVPCATPGITASALCRAVWRSWTPSWRRGPLGMVCGWISRAVATNSGARSKWARAPAAPRVLARFSALHAQTGGVCEPAVGQGGEQDGVEDIQGTIAMFCDRGKSRHPRVYGQQGVSEPLSTFSCGNLYKCDPRERCDLGDGDGVKRCEKSMSKD